MLTTLLLVAAATPATPDEDTLRDAANHGTSFFGGETSLILGAVLVVAAGIFFWAVFLRKRPETQRGSFVLTRARPEAADRSSSGRRRRRKRKAEHPENLPRNPTLAEIGGLPPLRPEDAPPAGNGPDASPEAQR
ncbi:MAG: hypothetical protein QOF48_1480 [Verrucomicrobiota bacterium]|jgi:hypothetical protein